MRIVLSLQKSLEENASVYYDKSKKARMKVEKIHEVLKKFNKDLIKIEKKKPQEKIKREKAWYEKFRWFFSSEGVLCIGGRDATTNEIVIKKHTEKNDLVFHTDMAGSPFFVLKGGSEESIKEVASATACFSRAWKAGLAIADVFYVTPEQVSKKAQSGEYVAHGAFMIYGKTTYVPVEMKLAIGVYNDAVMCGPVSAIKKHCKDHLVLVQGNDKPSDAAKKIRKKLGGELDDIVRSLPSGGIKILK